MKKLAKTRYDGDPSINLLETTIRKFDVLVKAGIDNVSKDAGSPSCHGCSQPGCCYQSLFVTLAEGLVIARNLIHNGLDTAGFRKKLEREGEEADKVGVDEWWKLARPCLMLKNARCTIYNIRPVMCRSHFSWSEPQLCQPPVFAKIKTVDMVGVKRGLLQVNRDLCQALGLDLRTAYISNLPKMVNTALEVLYCDTAGGIDYLQKKAFPSISELTTKLIETKNEEERS